MTLQRIQITVCLAACLWSGMADVQAGDADQKAKATGADSKESKYLRITRNKNQDPTALETSVTRFVSKPGAGKPITVDLVGAVHVGEKDYYDRLNKLFKSYDAVLYELVAPEGTRVEPGRSGGRHPISILQNVMKNVLKLQFQLDCIDYSRPNMVHADMSPAEFKKSMEDRGESFLGMFMRAMGQAMAAQQGGQKPPSDLELIVALVAKDRDARLKRLMAEQFENMEGQMSAISGPDGSTIITERNKKALKVLRDQLGKGKRRLAIFYGAGHLSDMAQRLEKDFGMKRAKQRWIVAWQISSPESKSKGDGGAKKKLVGSSDS